MKLFSCQQCQQTLFFENVQCTRCGLMLAYLPDRALLSALEPVPDSGGQGASPKYQALGADGAIYRLCRNYSDQAVCNWAVPDGDPEEFCRACRLNHLIPNLSDPQAKAAWQRIEIAKRRLLYTLLGLGLPVETKQENPASGLAFDFLKDDPSTQTPQVFTGHNDGLVTININEADDPFREKMRVQMGEPYRTLLGHFRHEIGHYYWDRLIKDGPRLYEFRQLFGDERDSYQEALDRHYQQGPPPNWTERFVSAYASMHPWEDWAETWAHYLHMVDTLQTARAYGLSLRPKTGALSQVSLTARWLDLHSFEDLIAGWIPLTVALNSLNRSMGAPDSYPFVLTEAAIVKLRFVHDVVETWASGTENTRHKAPTARVA
ncbi:MAG TPA: putative zinc-binding peptidase [Polyangia bacterium]